MEEDKREEYQATVDVGGKATNNGYDKAGERLAGSASTAAPCSKRQRYARGLRRNKEEWEAKQKARRSRMEGTSSSTPSTLARPNYTSATNPTDAKQGEVKTCNDVAFDEVTKARHNNETSRNSSNEKKDKKGTPPTPPAAEKVSVNDLLQKAHYREQTNTVKQEEGGEEPAFDMINDLDSKQQSSSSTNASSLPGAYSGFLGAGLDRRSNIRFSLVGKPLEHKLSSSLTVSRAKLLENVPKDGSNELSPNNVEQEQEQKQQGNGDITHPLAATNEEFDNNDEEDITRLGLAEAMAVVGESRLDIAEPFDPNEATRKRGKLRKKALLLSLLILMICLVVSGIVGWKVGTRNKVSESQSVVDLGHATAIKTSTPTASPTGFLEVLMDSLPDASLENLKVFGTPQWKALDWLEKHPDLPTMEEWRKQQLFALVTFFHKMEGPHWPEAIKKDWLQYATNECYWFSTGFGKFNFATGLWQEESRYNDEDDIMTPCNAGNRFQLLDLVGLELGDHNPRLPEEITLLSSLRVLSLNASSISAPLVDFLPKQFYQMTTLMTLTLGENNFTGTIPSQLGSTNISNLFLNSNSLTGGIPSELALLSTLNTIHLHLNHLTGTIPLEMTRLSSLQDMQLWGNSLTGSIPPQIGAMKNLKELALDGNSLTGTIPPSLVSLSNMSELWLSYNSLTGEVPPGFGDLVSNGSLVRFHIEENALTGEIEENICSLALNFTDWYSMAKWLSFDCSSQLCGCCWCPCSGGTNSSGEDCHLSQPEMFDPSKEDEDWPGSFPTPLNRSNTVTINIRTDEYPAETSWEWSLFTSQSGGWDTLDSAGQLLEKEMLFSYTMDVLSDATYRLRLSDALGDGSCCQYGFGWFSITTAAPSTDHAEGTVIWNATGDVVRETVDVILGIDSAGFAELVDSIEG